MGSMKAREKLACLVFLPAREQAACRVPRLSESSVPESAAGWGTCGLIMLLSDILTSTSGLAQIGPVN